MRLRDARDQHAWETFLEVYQPLILRLIRQKRVQEADAREVTQEVLLAVVNSIHRWEADPARGTFRAWLSTITRNLVVNFLIRQSRHPRGSGDSDVNQWLNQKPAPDCDASRVFDLERRRQIFRWAAEQIRPEFRESTWQAFWLTSIDGYDVNATAQQLGISPGALYVARSRVMNRIREKVEEFRELPSINRETADP
ncbi:RNA polymerase sigma factor [Schlesneria paludicola]|uniref:RNA polymerase sigma factor n=1 Tax=Schlesneria paludicola TaxID=360056 RepID=UPI001ED8F4E5|nr:sigma-70 family RNA polymerase sigma factor [Schlesneria paludicola]